MGIFTRERPRPTRGRQHLVASGKAIEVTDAQQIARYRARQSQDFWQERAGLYNDSLAIVGFGHDYVRDSISRVRPIPAIESDDPSKAPVPLTDETTPDGLDPALCDEILQRLAPFPTYMGQVAQKLDVFGEVHVGLIEDHVDGDGQEEVKIWSPRELYVQGEQWRWKRDRADSLGVPISPDAPFWRIWQPHPEFSSLPYSHMIRLLLPCEELLLLTQLIKGIARSRIATTGKLLAISQEASLESPTPDGEASTEDAGDGEDRSDTFIDDFIAAAIAAIGDPESAAAALPIILRLPQDLVEKGVKAIDMGRPFEDVLLKLREEARGEIATGMNLPREILLGVGQTNHWNADAIREQAWLEHLEPRAMAIVNATTTSFYRPALLANGVDPEIVKRCCVWYDPTWFLGTPDRAEGADRGLDAFAISLASWREAKGYSDDDAPTDEEIQMRIGWKQQELVRTTIREDAGAAQGEVQVVDPAGNKPAPKAQDTPKVAVPDATDKTDPNAPLAASARSSKLERLGPKLVAIERDLRTRLHAATEAALTLALEKAGLKARNTVNKVASNSSRTVRDQHKALLAQIDAVPAAGIVAALGPMTMQSYGLNDEALLAGALVSLEPKYHTMVRRAQLAAARAAADASDREIDEEQVDLATKDARVAGWTVLSAGALALARTLLHDPHPEAPAFGEFDESTVVPIGLIRAALDRAGGAQEGPPGRGGMPTSAPSRSVGPGGPPDALGATQGPTMLDEFKQQLGITEDGYVWDYGEADRKPFPPHEDLDGLGFTAWDDDVLANSEGWPDVPFYRPQDHQGCCCDVVVIWSQAEVTE